MKKLIGILLLTWPLLLQAQKNKDLQVGAGAQVFYSNRLWVETKGTSFQRDSLNDMDRGIAGLIPQVWVIRPLNKTWTLQTGLSYTVYGFQRRSPNIKYGDQMHPDLPRFTDLLQGDPRYIDFIYRFHALSVPVLFNREIIGLRKSLTLRYYFSGGATLGYVIYDKTVARTRGFGFDGTNRFVVNNIYNKQPFMAQLNLGMRIEYMVDEKLKVQFQPMVNLPLTSSLKNGEKAFVYSGGINLGLTYLPNRNKDRE